MRRLRAQLIGCALLAAPMAASASGKPGYIATPDTCYVPQKVEADTVYLKKAGVCGGKPGRAFIETERETLRVVVEGKFWQEVRVEQMGVPDISASLAKSDRLAESMTIPKNRHEEEMAAAAAKLDSYYRSEEFQGRLKSETERIRSQVFGENFARFYPDSVAEESRGRLEESERVYVFVSSSMPMQTVRNYVASVARLDEPRVVLVMRGFVGGMSRIQPTIRFVADALKRAPSCSPAETECEMLPAKLIVDPLLYRRYGIDRVPAVVFVRGVKAGNPGLSEGDVKNADVAESYAVYGDASLEYILQVIGRESGASSLKTLLGERK